MSNKRLKKSNKRSKKNLSRKKTQSKYHTLNLKVLDKLNSQGVNTEKVNFIDNPDETKMSAVILKIAEPFIKKYWGNENRIRVIISLAVTVWNIAFLSPKEQGDLQDKLLEDVLPKEGDAKDMVTLFNVFNELQRRQKNLYPNIRKIIMGYDLRLDKENMHLDISSAPIGEET